MQLEHLPRQSGSRLDEETQRTGGRSPQAPAPQGLRGPSGADDPLAQLLEQHPDLAGLVQSLRAPSAELEETARLVEQHGALAPLADGPAVAGGASEAELFPGLCVRPSPTAEPSSFVSALDTSVLHLPGRAYCLGVEGEELPSSAGLDRLAEAGLLQPEERAALEGSDFFAARSDTPLGEGAIQRTVDTGANTESLQVGRNLAFALEEGGILKVKGALWADSPVAGQNAIVRQKLPAHLPTVPINARSTTWAEGFFSQSGGMAAAAQQNGALSSQLVERFCPPKLARRAPFVAQLRETTEVELPDGRRVPYVEALGLPAEYLKNGQGELFREAVWAMRSQLPEEVAQAYERCSLEQMQRVLASGDFASWGPLAEYGHPAVTRPVPLDYERDVKALGGEALVTKKNYVRSAFLAGAFLTCKGAPTESLEYEPSTLRNSRAAWVGSPREGLAAMGRPDASLAEQADFARAQVRELYRLTEATFPEGAAHSLAEGPRGLDGATLARELHAQSGGEAQLALSRGAEGVAQVLAAHLAGNVGFQRHRLMRKDFIGPYVTDPSDFLRGSVNDAAELGRVVSQAGSQVEAMGRMLGAPQEERAQAKARCEASLASALQANVAQVLSGQLSGPLARAVDPQVLRQSVEAWRQALEPSGAAAEDASGWLQGAALASPVETSGPTYSVRLSVGGEQHTLTVDTRVALDGVALSAAEAAVAATALSGALPKARSAAQRDLLEAMAGQTASVGQEERRKEAYRKDAVRVLSQMDLEALAQLCRGEP